jgi:hypothetical protein
MAAGRFVDVTNKEISEIKINSILKTQKTCVKILKQLFASCSVIIGEYSPRLSFGESLLNIQMIYSKYYLKGEAEYL